MQNRWLLSSPVDSDYTAKCVHQVALRPLEDAVLIQISAKYYPTSIITTNITIIIETAYVIIFLLQVGTIRRTF